MANHDPVAFEAAAREVGFLGFGCYPRSGFIHVDLGPARQWGERFPVRETAFAEETPPAREILADSCTMKGGGAAGVATLGAAGVEVRRASWRRPNPRSCRWCRISIRSAGCSSSWHSVTLWSRSTPASTTGAGGGGDRHLARRDRHEPVDAGGPALQRRRARRAPVPAFASALRRANGTPR